MLVIKGIIIFSIVLFPSVVLYLKITKIIKAKYNTIENYTPLRILTQFEDLIEEEENSMLKKKYKHILWLFIAWPILLIIFVIFISKILG